MLAISRRHNESVIIQDEQGTEVKVKVLDFKDDNYGRRVVLGFDAPREWPVHREEVVENMDMLSSLKVAFESVPRNVQRQFLTEVGSTLLAKSTHAMLTELIHQLERLGVVEVEEHQYGGRTVFRTIADREASPTSSGPPK